VTRALASLAVLAAALALVAAGCGGGGDNEAAPTTTETTTTETTPPATGGEATGDATKGEQLFASEGCGGCHTFSKANSSGSVGPNLDDLSPSFDAVVDQVTNGGGGMPAFKDKLSEQQIRDVAAFVSGQSS
jgi:mono/diheme cytochrome c family protein